MAVVQPAARPPGPEVRMEAVAAAMRAALRRGTAAEAAAVLHLLEALGRGPGPAAAEHLFRQLVRLGGRHPTPGNPRGAAQPDRLRMGTL